MKGGRFNNWRERNMTWEDDWERNDEEELEKAATHYKVIGKDKYVPKSFFEFYIAHNNPKIGDKIYNLYKTQTTPLEKLQTQDTQLQTQNTQLQQKNNELQKKYDELKTQNNDLQTQNTQLQTQVKSYEETLEI